MGKEDPNIDTILALRRQIEKRQARLSKIFEERYDAIRKQTEGCPACKFLGLKCIELYQGFAHWEMKAKEEFISWEGFVHGGIISALVDNTLGAAVETLIGFEDRNRTAHLTVDYFSPVRLNECICAKAYLSEPEPSVIKTRPNSKRLLHLECSVIAKPVCHWEGESVCQPIEKSERRQVAKGSAWFVVSGKKTKTRKSKN